MSAAPVLVVALWEWNKQEIQVHMSKTLRHGRQDKYVGILIKSYQLAKTYPEDLLIRACKGRENRVVPYVPSGNDQARSTRLEFVPYT